MKLVKNLIYGAALGLATIVAGTSAFAQNDWPTRPVTLVVPFAAGTSVDNVARQLASVLEKDLGQQVVIDNKVGAGGTIGTGAVARSTPDGYTFVFGTISTHAINLSLMNNIGYHPINDFTPVVGYAEAASILVANPKVGAKDLSQLLDIAKTRKISFASHSIGSTAHLGSFMLNQEAKIETKLIPYSDGANAVLDLLAGEVDVTLYTYPAVQAHLQAGKLLPLAVTGTNRMTALPDVPTFAEEGLPGVSITAWYAVYAPKGVPAAIVERMNKAVNMALHTPEILERLAAQGMAPKGGTPDDLAAFTQSEIDRYASLLKAAGIEKQ